MICAPRRFGAFVFSSSYRPPAIWLMKASRSALRHTVTRSPSLIRSGKFGFSLFHFHRVDTPIPRYSAACLGRIKACTVGALFCLLIAAPLPLLYKVADKLTSSLEPKPSNASLVHAQYFTLQPAHGTA